MIQRKTVTQKDIARELNIGQITVSRVINGDAKVKQELRNRILKVCEEMGYQHNLSARTMRTGVTNTIALFNKVSNKISCFPDQLFDGIRHAVFANDLSLLLEVMPEEDHLQQGKIPKSLRTQQVDGMILNYTHDVTMTVKQYLERQPLPYVWINMPDPFNCVRPDDYDAGYRSTVTLIEQSFRKIYYADLSSTHLNPNPNFFYSVDRYRGYFDAMLEAGLEPVSLSDSKSIPYREWLDYVDTFLIEHKTPFGVVGEGNINVIPFLISARIEGISIPDEIGLISIDDEYDYLMNPPISNMCHDWHSIGVRTVEMLFDKIRGKRHHLPSEKIPMLWKPRGTTKVNESNLKQERRIK